METGTGPDATLWKFLARQKGGLWKRDIFGDEMPRRARPSQTELFRAELAERLEKRVDEILSRPEALEWAAAHSERVNPKEWTNNPHRAPMFYGTGAEDDRRGRGGRGERAFYVIDHLVQWRDDVDGLLKAIEDNGKRINRLPWPDPRPTTPAVEEEKEAEQPTPHYTRAEKRRRQAAFERALERSWSGPPSVSGPPGARSTR